MMSKMAFSTIIVSKSAWRRVKSNPVFLSNACLGEILLKDEGKKNCKNHGK